MIPTLIFVFLVFAVFGLACLLVLDVLRPLVGETGRVSERFTRASDLERLAARLRDARVEQSSATVFFYPSDLLSTEDLPNLRLTFAGGHVCVDWPPHSPRSTMDADRFEAFARRHARAVLEVFEGPVSYLRATSDTPGEFCLAMLRELYGVTADDPVVTLLSGEAWVSARFTPPQPQPETEVEFDDGRYVLA